jgi:hypothetical protein
VNSRAGYGAVEAAGAVDAQTDARPQAPWTPANGRRRPQLPQPASAGRRTYNPSRPHLSRAPFWSEEWGPPHFNTVGNILRRVAASGVGGPGVEGRFELDKVS